MTSPTGCNRCSTGTGRASPRTSASSWTGSSWRMRPARWSVSGASGPAAGSRCWKAAATTTRSSSRSKKPKPRCSRRTWGAPRYRNHARRVVEGQRLMQAASDLFLGWTHDETSGVDYYWRNLRDMKVVRRRQRPADEYLLAYADLCGATLARAHAAFRRRGGHLGLPRQRRRLRQSARPLRDFVCRSERT